MHWYVSLGQCISLPPPPPPPPSPPVLGEHVPSCYTRDYYTLWSILSAVSLLFFSPHSRCLARKPSVCTSPHITTFVPLLTTPSLFYSGRGPWHLPPISEASYTLCEAPSAAAPGPPAAEVSARLSLITLAMAARQVFPYQSNNSYVLYTHPPVLVLSIYGATVVWHTPLDTHHLTHTTWHTPPDTRLLALQWSPLEQL